MPWVVLQCVVVIFPDHTHLHFLKYTYQSFESEMKFEK